MKQDDVLQSLSILINEFIFSLRIKLDFALFIDRSKAFCCFVLFDLIEFHAFMPSLTLKIRWYPCCIRMLTAMVDRMPEAQMTAIRASFANDSS